MTAQAGKLEMGYGLTWNPNPPVTVPQLVTYAMAAGVYTILAWVSVVSAPIQIPGVGALFIAMGFGVPFPLWVGGWGLVVGLGLGSGGWIPVRPPACAPRGPGPPLRRRPIGQGCLHREGIPLLLS